MRIRAGISVLLLAAWLPAQEPVQEQPGDGELPVKTWLSGGPVRLQGANAAKLVLLAWLPPRQPLDNLQEPLATLQRRLGEAGLRVVALLHKAPAAPLPPASPFAVGLGFEELDPNAAGLFMPARAYLVASAGPAWVGTFANGPGRIAARMLDGSLAGDDLEQFVALQHQILDSDDFGFEYGDGRLLLQGVDKLLAENRADGMAWALRYCVAVMKLADGKLAAETLQGALAALVDEPLALGAFADLVLRTDLFGPELGQRLWPVLTQACPLAPLDRTLQLATLRALVRAAKDREVGRRAQQLRKQFDGDAAALIELAEVLAAASVPMVHKDVADGALRRAQELLPAAASDATATWMSARYVVAKRCGEDDEAAAQWLKKLLPEPDGGDTLNNMVWYMMSRLDSRGRFVPLSTALCEQLLQRRDKLVNYELDTCALGMFLAGRPELAVELQQQAIEKAGGGKPEYQERLKLYEGAVAAAKR